MNPALDKYYESLLELKGGAAKKKRSGKKRSGKKKSGKKSSGKKKTSRKKTSRKKTSRKKTSRKNTATKRQPRIVDHSIGKSQLDRILGGIPILSPVNPYLTSVDTYNPLLPYTQVNYPYTEVTRPNYSNTAEVPMVPPPSRVTGGPGVDLADDLVAGLNQDYNMNPYANNQLNYGPNMGGDMMMNPGMGGDMMMNPGDMMMGGDSTPTMQEHINN